MKRFLLVLGLVLALSLVFAGSAFANFGPHGGYATDTDSCAACHRAHSSFSSVKFTPKDAPPNFPDADKPFALLVGSAQSIQEFCYACHGDLAPGASTNVQSGVFDSGPSGSTGLNPGNNSGFNTTTDGGAQVVIQYRTESTFNAPLNGGGFGNANGQILDTTDFFSTGAHTYKNVSSAHEMEQNGPLWGVGNAVTNLNGFTCTSCHDPHGSSNYRLLRDTVNGNTRGGYVGAQPNAWVTSTETNYPAATGGWLKHDAGAAQMALYQPNYTARSAIIKAGVSGKSMSSWCAGCHVEYDKNSSAYNYAPYEPTNGVAQAANPDMGINTAHPEYASGVGSQQRHRHPVDITLQQGDGILEVNAQDPASTLQVSADTTIPLEAANGGTYRQDHVGCLTCHFAHGSTVTMSGWANAHLVQNANGTWVPERDSQMGVSPDKVNDLASPPGGGWTDQYSAANVTAGSSALLRGANREVCERCHNK